MKRTNIAIAITLLLATFASPPCRADQEPKSPAGAVYWANPDGSEGAALVFPLSYGSLAWANPDGTQGVTKRYPAPARALEHAWVNPDGHKGLSMAALNGGQQSVFARPTSKQPDVARHSDQPLYHATRSDGSINMFTILLAILVAGSTLLLAGKLWPH
jgi:hypothetical protein